MKTARKEMSHTLRHQIIIFIDPSTGSFDIDPSIICNKRIASFIHICKYFQFSSLHVHIQVYFLSLKTFQNKLFQTTECLCPTNAL